VVTPVRNLPAVIRRGGVPAIVAGWLALGWWPLPQLLPRLFGHALDLRTAVVTVLAIGAGLWYIGTHKGKE
jgi:hypothetical protein